MAPEGVGLELKLVECCLAFLPDSFALFNFGLQLRDRLIAVAELSAQGVGIAVIQVLGTRGGQSRTVPDLLNLRLGLP